MKRRERNFFAAVRQKPGSLTSSEARTPDFPEEEKRRKRRRRPEGRHRRRLVKTASQSSRPKARMQFKKYFCGAAACHAVRSASVASTKAMSVFGAMTICSPRCPALTAISSQSAAVSSI